VQYRLRADDGGWHTIDRGRVIERADGRPLRMLGISADITERAPMRRARKARRRFRDARHGAPVAVLLYRRPHLEVTGRRRPGGHVGGRVEGTSFAALSWWRPEVAVA
jgi:hypothetical protein